ncbi:hypothetical protein JCM17846_28270 [Iodidimonas nitroreducens]|uniref:DNA helicase n=1 Tax=Iodidimonas nitroreducens TaxID=1236968 RepID=A0A5A7NC06_9PROT|nr:DUF3320 domain-containing protein [Iodidimonas nitroreducens]GAK34153.1 hypothetical protein AQ1_02049 [alpha proteobacterium Q-1]GER05145.1 hypothetical protein JCM17846_28270 [Iodidimonas nitroreducens]
MIDADASQTKVIEEVRHGSSLVVQGPPGTGKSQTITNIIAAAAHDGKSVLFVAEKMAALSVVHDRLMKAGLRDICLELHSRKANKKALAQELGRTLSASARALPDAADPAKLRLTRDELNKITALLHTPLAPCNDSPFHAISEIIGFIGKGTRPPSLLQEDLADLDREARKQALAAITAFVEALKASGPPEAHPFRGTKALDLQPTDLARLADDLTATVAAISELQQEAARISHMLHRPEPGSLSDIQALSAGLAALADAPDGTTEKAATLFVLVGQPRLEEALRIGADWATAQAAAAEKFAPPAWKTNLDGMRQIIVRGQTSFLSRLFGPYRRVSVELASILSGPLPKDPTERLALLDELAEVQVRRLRLAEEEDWLESCLGAEWRGERTPFASLLNISIWLAQIKRSGTFSEAASIKEALLAFPDPCDIAKALEDRAKTCRATIETSIARLRFDLEEAEIGNSIETVPMGELAAILADMQADTGRYNDWTRLVHSIDLARSRNAGGIIDAVTEGTIAPDDAKSEFTYACAEARWNAARAARPELNTLSQLDRHERVRLFRNLEKGHINTAKILILSRHFEQMPRGTMGEMGVIRREIGRKRGHKPIRWMMKNAGSMVQRIKPVMLMSPISVAQFLPPGSVSFDLLVIDEASQIRPEDALGVVARAKQIVVVGDQKQLPPTSFFDRLVDDTEESDDEDEDAPVGATAADMESILSLCEASGLRSRMLEWHYRSRDPSLISVSNAEFYDSNLVLPPSPLQLDADYGLKFRHIPGIYVSGRSGAGRKGTNRIEAEAVAQAVASHARNWPDLSLGVVAFSKAQANMLTEVLELERRRDSVLDAFLREGRHEDVFVKNIENVQGDERDVILISVGYGPQEPNGRLNSMSFGPVNGEGGERRLNVLFSRARIRCEVFASFDPGDIDPTRSKHVGPRILKRFLDFAKTGNMEERVATGAEADSPFEEDVAAVIRSLGYLADPQVGTAGFRIDLGVRHPDQPGQYLLAVECDGATYHSALWARERDRLRQDVLEGLGWRFHRIWSTDWFHHRSREIERLAEALERARTAVENGIRVRGANHETFQAAPEMQPEIEGPVPIDHRPLRAPAYMKAEFFINSMIEPHEVPVEQLADLVAKIVAIEGPIHIDEVTRRLTSAHGKSRAGRRIAEATKHAVHLAIQRDSALIQSEHFLLTDEQAKNPPIRDRSAETGSLLKAIYISPLEIKAAAERIWSESGEMTQEQLTRAIARLLGFRRVGNELAAEISKVVNNDTNSQ